jgi:broad specificity phosphatase PhoE
LGVRLLLIRHAETTANAERLLDTAPPGADLTDLGRTQAAELVESLAEIPLDALYVSDLVRTHQTAAPLAVLYRWADGQSDARIPGGESGSEVMARFDAVVAEAAQHGSAAIISHGAVIRAWTGARAANVDKAFVADTRLHNTAVIVLDGDPEAGWVVDTWANEPVPQLD